MEAPKATVVLKGINEIHCECLNPDNECKYAFYVYKDSKEIGRYPYQEKPEMSYWALESGEYSFKVFALNPKGEKISRRTNTIRFEPENEINCNQEPPAKSFSWIRNVFSVLGEIWENKERLIRISRYRYKVLNKDAYLGSVWNILTPFIQIATYWFVFGIGLRQNKDVDGFPFLVWMLCGLIPWFFMSPCIVKGAGAIRSRGLTALKMKYPVVTMPLEEVIMSFYNHVVMLGVLFIIIVIFGIPITIYWLNLIYYFLFVFVFFTSFGMVTSVISMIATDFQNLVNSLIRLWFYITPILWSADRLPETVQKILQLNPCLYVVDGFRDSILYKKAFYEHPNKMVFFWALALVFLVLGCNLMTKYKNQFMDME